MKNISIFSGLVFWTGLVMAQLTNTGLPMGITSGTVLSGDTLRSSGPVTNDGIIVMSGDIDLTGGYTGVGDIKLNGADQAMNLGVPGNLNNLTISGGGTKSIFSELTIDAVLQLDSGKALPLGNNFRLSSTASITGSDAGSYVIGKLIRSGIGDLFYPIGTAGQYAPVTLRSVTGTNPEVGVELVNTDPLGQIGVGIVNLS